MLRKKFLAAMLSAAMVVSMFPATVSAAVTSITLGGAVVNLGTGSQADLDSAKGSNAGSVTLTSTEAIGAETVIVVPSNDSFKVAHIASADLASTLSDTIVTGKTAGDQLAATNFEDGDALAVWYNDDGAGQANYYVVMVTVNTGTTGDGSTGSIGGDSTVLNPEFKVVLPMDIDFAIDPFELSDDSLLDGNQITGAVYPIANKTEAPVKVKFDFTTTLESDISFVADPTTLSPDDDTVTDKNLYFAALGAKTITEDGNDVDEATFDEEENGTLIPFAEDGTASTAFVLAAGDGTDIATGGTGTAAFTFYGVLNSYAKWEDGDITVEANYTLSALRPSTYTALSDDAVGVNQVSVGSASVVKAAGWTDGDATRKAYGSNLNASKATNGTTGFALPFSVGTDSSKLTSIGTSNPSSWVLDTDYSIEADGTIKISAGRITGWSTGSKNLSIVYDGVVYTIIVVLA